MQSPQPHIENLESRRLLSDGALDNTFAGGGLFTDPQMTAILDMAVQKDGKVVAVGYRNNASATSSNAMVSRFNDDGTLDSSFGSGGHVTIDFGRSSTGRAVAIASDGSIIVAGAVGGAGSGGSVGSDIALARLNANGTLDNSFTSDGQVITDLGALASSETAVDVGIDGDGRIVVGAQNNSQQRSGWTLLRYLGNGGLDTTFGTSGIVSEPGGTLNAIEVQKNGKVVTAGELDEACSGVPPCTASTAAVLRYTAGGARDATFGVRGVAANSIQTTGQEHVAFTDLAFQGRKIIAVGLRQTQNAADVIAARFSKAGIREHAFDTSSAAALPGDRTVMRNSDVEVQVQPDNKVVIGFTSSTLANREQKFSVVRLEKGGELDQSFGPGNTSNGGVTTSGLLVFINFGNAFDIGDGTVLIGGFSTQTRQEVTPTGGGMTNINFDDQLGNLHALALQNNGRIITAGRAYDISPGNPQQASAAVAALEGGFENSVGPDREPPRAVLQTTHPEARGTETQIIVRYIDNRAINVRTIDHKDFVITGPNGFRKTAKVLRINGNSDDVRVLYSFGAPGGHWNRADEGLYIIRLQERQIKDVVGNFAPPEELGRFRVQFAPR